jgi:hypothetical protein
MAVMVVMVVVVVQPQGTGGAGGAGGAGGGGCGDGGNGGHGWLYNHKGLVVLVVMVVMVVVVVQPGCSTWIVVYFSPPPLLRLFGCEASFGTFGTHILPLFSAAALAANCRPSCLLSESRSHI